MAPGNHSIIMHGTIFKGDVYRGMDVGVMFKDDSTRQNAVTCCGVIEEVLENGRGIPIAYKSSGEIAVRVGVRGRYSFDGIMVGAGSNCALYNIST